MGVEGLACLTFSQKLTVRNSLRCTRTKYQICLKEVFKITWVRASEESVFMFVIFETKEIGDQLFCEMSEWRNNTILKSQIRLCLMGM
ncbi:MAG: hypothetical protein CM15mP58_23090 [Burkholderiaceae bacterium]|nr:MAG: hypothetical protein CM15mP58_23090 [Burkholderiaceae bacterium]